MSNAGFTDTAHVGCRVLTLGRMLTELPVLLEYQLKQPLVEELIAALTGVTKIVTERKWEDAVGAQWAALAVGKEVEEKGTSSLPSEVSWKEVIGRTFSAFPFHFLPFLLSQSFMFVSVTTSNEPHGL